jgi:hypothetical protein
MTIQAKLNTLKELRTSLDVLAIEKQKMIDTVYTPEIRAKISDIEAEFSGKGEIAKTKADELEKEIKEEVIELGVTVKGDFLMAVWNKGRTTWNTEALDGYAAGHPEIEQFRKTGKPSIAIKDI